jgi:glycosyltransferase involved in cell wall biosynthesis
MDDAKQDEQNLATAGDAQRPDLTILIPTYNEEGSIADCIRRLPAMPWSIEILVVDNSSDRTPVIVRSIPGVRLEHYRPAQGKGHAIWQGMRAARGKVIVICDVDMDPTELPPVVQPIFDGQADFVNGSRMILPMERGAMSFTHRVGNTLFAVAMSILTCKHFTDVYCGFKAWRADLLPANQFHENTWPDLELLFNARRGGLRIVEAPVRYTKRKFGASKMHTWRHGWNLLCMMLRLAIGRGRIKSNPQWR